MACSKCKKKERFQELESTTDFISSGVIIFGIVWSLFAIYGVYSLIKLFI